MTKEAGRPNDEAPPQKPSPRLHRSTIVFVVLVAVALVLVMLPGQVVLSTDFTCYDAYGKHLGAVTMHHHGWPITFVVREPPTVATYYVSPLPPRWEFWGSLWNPTERVVYFNVLWLLSDVLIAVFLALILGALFERWRRRHRRLLQIHLIDVFVLTALVAAALSYWSTNRKQHDRELQTVNEISDISKPDWLPGGVTWLRWLLGDRPFAAFDRVNWLTVYCNEPARLSKLGNLSSLKRLTLSGELCDGQLEPLREVMRLEALELSDVYRRTKAGKRYFSLHAGRLSDEDFLSLPPMPRLRLLDMSKTAFRGDGLDRLTSLEVVNLSGTDIDDEALRKLEPLRSLRVLCLSATKVTDAGLEHLRGLTQLRELWLRNTHTTKDGEKRLQKAIPKCMIVSEPPPPDPADSDPSR